MYLTTARLVFVSKDYEKNEFKSFDFPLAFLSNEKFEQPIFGSNYLAGNFISFGIIYHRIKLYHMLNYF